MRSRMWRHCAGDSNAFGLSLRQVRTRGLGAGLYWTITRKEGGDDWNYLD